MLRMRGTRKGNDGYENEREREEMVEGRGEWVGSVHDERLKQER